jgi:ribonuclease HI
MSSESEVYFGFSYGASRHTRRISSEAWVIFTPGGQFLSFRGICLGDATNNVVEYSAVIEFLCDSLSHGISHLQVYIDAQLVVSQSNGVYHIYDPTFHQRFLRLHLLECYFDYIMCIHVPRRFNHMTYTLYNQVLDWHVAHTYTCT